MTAPRPVPALAQSGPDVLGVLLTSKCNILCRHCCNDSHPVHAGAIDFGEIARVIGMARQIPSISEVGISGGEPFLFIPLLCRVVAFATSLGFSSSVTTNGYWGNSRHSSRNLADLAAAGLRAIHISTSVFHREFIDVKTVITAAAAALDVGLKVGINLVATPSFTRADLEVALGELTGEVGIVVMPSLPAGRGRTGIHDDEFVSEFAVPPGNCREHFRKLAVDRTGDVYPCCSPGGFTAPLLLGNVRDMPLASLLEASSDSKLLAILELVGPRFFLPFLRAAGVGPPLPERFSDQCHLCHQMLSSDAYAGVIAAAAQQLFAELNPELLAQTSHADGRLTTMVRQGRRPTAVGAEPAALFKEPEDA